MIKVKARAPLALTFTFPPRPSALFKDFVRLLLGAALVLCAQPGVASAEPRAKVGTGIGLAYGSPFPGVGAELELGQHVSVLGGASAVTGDVTWSYGARVYLRGRARRWRPHVSVFRWTEGNAIYGGVDHDVGQPSGFSMTYGVGYGDANLEGRVGIMLGLGYRF